MFDKTLFDRNAFDRSVSSDGITLTMMAHGDVIFNFIVKTPTGAAIGSAGSLVSNVQMRQNIVNAFAGAGSIPNVTMLLRRSTAAPLTGDGVLNTNLVVRTPITGALSGAGGVLVDSRLFLYQNMIGNLSGVGAFTPRPIFETELFCDVIRGIGEMSPHVNLQLPLKISSKGQGAFILRRLGSLNENVIELFNINLLPGETITIDTDLMVVLFGSVEDVSATSTESVFFELNPGANELAIDLGVDDSHNTMAVTAIWQNRWL